MLAVARRALVKNTQLYAHSELSCSYGRYGVIRAMGLQHRQYWWGNDGDKEKDKDKAQIKPEEDAASDKNASASSNLLTSIGSGDDAPKWPLLVGLPVSRRPLFPGLLQSVSIADERVIDALMKRKEAGNAYIGVFLRKTELDDSQHAEVITAPEDIYHTGIFAQIHNVIESPMDTRFVLMAHRRITIEEFKDIGPPLQINVRHWPRPQWDPNSDRIRAMSNEVLTAIRDLLKVNMLAQEYLQFYVNRIDAKNPFKLADFAASITNADGHELQKILECEGAEERLMLSLELLTKEREVYKVQQQISQQVEEKISKQQREYFLNEQLKNIKKELGMEKDDKEALLTKFRERIESFQAHLTADVKRAIDEELAKLASLEKNSPEFNVTRSYLDWLTHIPWGRYSDENLDVKSAKVILDRDHYGLKDVKNRILEFIAVGKLKGSVQGKIICLVGPPGVGKTSIGKSIAQALNREFYRFSVGGLTDVAEIKGHRRTYIGAMPGKVIQCLKSTNSSNPLILIDEIDKLGRGYQGDPASALLELLDPNQNSSFVDHYMDVPVDLSKVLFICTANVEDTIPGPLHDRMEMIRLSGYDVPEKVAIAEQYLIPKAMEASGLKNASDSGTVSVAQSSVDSLVRWYCRESGVRNLEKHIDRICRKLAFQLVSDEAGLEMEDKDRVPLFVTSDNLDKFVGKPRFTKDRMYQDADGDGLPAGVVMGLAWTAMGGSSLYIETAAIAKEGTAGGGLQSTGQMGSVMQESSRIAFTYARRWMSRMPVSEGESARGFFDKHEIHLHVPEGATPKDGPSAGITMVTSLLSLALARPIRSDLAMTGELSLTGKVLPVGGIKEKLIAARRAGVSVVVLPEGNRRDFDELPGYLKEGLTVHFADQYEDVFAVAFEGLPLPDTNKHR